MSHPYYCLLILTFGTTFGNLIYEAFTKHRYMLALEHSYLQCWAIVTTFVVLALAGCTSDQLATFQSVAKPIADAAIQAESDRLGLPPGTATVLNAAKSSLFGAAVQAWAQQPAKAGANSPAVGNAIQAKLPASTGPDTAKLLTQAAQSIAVPAKPATSP